MVNVRVVARLLVLEMRELSQDDHALCIMPFIDLKGFLHSVGGNNVNVT